MSLWQKIRARWNKREANAWTGSTLFHLGILFCLSLFFLPFERTIVPADLESKLETLDEPAEIESLQLQPLAMESSSSVELEVPEAPALSVEVADLQVERAESLSTVDLAPIDATADFLDALNPSGMAAKGDGGSWSSRGSGNKRGMLGSQGGTRQTEDAVHAGLNWLMRHQHPDGHWSMDHTERAKGPTTGAAKTKSDMAATAMGVLPFLAANYTHVNADSPYRDNVQRALGWMVRNQKENGWLTVAPDSVPMYTHGLATIALCEAYGLTKDPKVRKAAEKAVAFTIAHQNQTGGWRYSPSSPDADTSMLGWHVMGLKSAQMAGLEVPSTVFEGCRKFLATVARGNAGGIFYYTPHKAYKEESTTAIGILCLQYMGSTRDDPAIAEGIELLMRRLPSDAQRDTYYWYYATQAVHNQQGQDWDRWNRQMRRILVESQNRQADHTDHGSWDPGRPTADKWAVDAGGRHMSTTLSILILEVYYRYLPLYKMGDDELIAAVGGSETSDGEEMPAEEITP